MKITSIKQQAKNHQRYSIFVEESYAFSLGEAALLDSKVYKGQEINEEELKELKTKSTDDKLYIQTLNYVSRYNKTKWEVSQYLKRKTESPALIELILNKLSILGLIDDFKFAKTYTSNRLRLRPTSRRKIQYELIKKHVEKVAIDQAMANIEVPESSSLNSLIEKKRLQTKYQDSTKLMQYLARQGFNYEDIKQAIKDISQ
jgi:regulatory protein